MNVGYPQVERDGVIARDRIPSHILTRLIQNSRQVLATSHRHLESRWKLKLPSEKLLSKRTGDQQIAGSRTYAFNPIAVKRSDQSVDEILFISLVLANGRDFQFSHVVLLQYFETLRWCKGTLPYEASHRLLIHTVQHIRQQIQNLFLGQEL
jgi:hypothetical protein